MLLNKQLEHEWQREAKFLSLRPLVTRSLDYSKNLISARKLQAPADLKAIPVYDDTYGINAHHHLKPSGRHVNPLEPHYEYLGRQDL